MIPLGGRREGTTETRTGPGPGRAQASTIGTVLVFSMMIVGALAIVVFGSVAIGDSQNALAEQRAEKAMTQLDSKAALVALGNTDVQQVTLGQNGGGEVGVENGRGWLVVTIENQTSGTTETLLNESLGAVTYEVNGNTLAYQGGGVWKRTEGDASVMVSPPEFHFRNGTLTLPVVNVTGTSTLGSKASVGHEATIRKYPNATAGDVNPLTNHVVKVTVKSDYYRGWGSYFEERTDGNVAYDDDRKIANLTLVSPIAQQRVTAATASLSASGAFEIHGSARSRCPNDGDVQNGGNEMYTNSYNSSQSGDYCTQANGGGYGHEGDIVYGKDINISDGSGGSWIHGDVASGENVTVSSGGAGKPSVFGNINFTDSCNPSVSDCQSRVEQPGASVNEIDGIDTANAIDFYVENRIEDINSSGNPPGAPIDANDRLEFDASAPSDEVELTNGSYTLDRIDFTANTGGDEIILNTSGGKIDLAVLGDVTVPDDANITVEGDGHVRMYVGNRTGHKTNPRWALRMDKESGILNDGDDAEQFRLYGKRDMDARIGDGGGGGDPAKFVGVIYTPPGDVGNGTVKLKKGEVFGGVLTGTTVITNSGGSIHYDEALRNEQVISRSAKVVKVTYLHVSINRIEVS